MHFMNYAMALGSLASLATALPQPSKSSWDDQAQSTYSASKKEQYKSWQPSSTSSWKSSPSTSSWAASKPTSTGSSGDSSSSPALTSNATTSGGGAGDGDLGIPSGLLTSKGGISFGFLPDSGKGENMAQINGKLGGKKAAAYGWYSQITSSKYDDSQLTQVMDDLKKSGAVFIPAVMPTKVKFSQIDSDLASQIAASMKKFTDEGIEVWLRFAHEVNWYVTDGTYAGGSAQEFVQAWKNVAEACKSNDKVKMYWSPNNAKSDSLKSWFPGADYVDIVGIDIYPKPYAKFADTYGDFYNAFAKAYNKPFVVGETGAGSSDTGAKEDWLKQLTNSDFSSFPLYKSASWFEYNKEEDFHVITDVDQSTLQQSLSNFA